MIMIFMAGGQDQEPAGRKEGKAQKCFSELKCYKKYKYLFFKTASVYTYK